MNKGLSTIATLDELRDFIDKKSIFTRERFFHYFTILGSSKKDVEKYWYIFSHFPYFSEEDVGELGYVIEKILAYPKSVDTCKNIKFYYTPHKNKKKVYYNIGSEISTFEIDLNETQDIILYADFLQKNPEIIVVVDFIEEINNKGKYFQVYDGDIFSTSDIWSKEDGEIYICNDGIYKKLLYTKGRGYLRDGKPDYDEGDYNFYVIMLKDKFECIGNVYADSSVLIDREVEKK